MSQLSLRAATVQDASSLAALALEVWFATYIRHGINAHFADFALGHFTPARFGAWIEGSAHQIIVSQNRDGIDAYIHLNTRANDPVHGDVSREIVSLYVQPRHQGRGLGAGLLRALRDTCDGPFWLAVNCENTKARRFYDAQNFTKLGEVAFKIGDKAYPNDILVGN